VVAAVPGKDEPAAQTTADNNGRFELRVVPGTYILKSAKTEGLPLSGEMPITVKPGSDAIDVPAIRLRFASGTR
jgi:hypothetical protein